MTPDAPVVQGQTVRDLIRRHAASRRGRISHIFPAAEMVLDWVQIEKRALECAGRLLRLGLGKGESVAWLAANGPGAVTCLFGALYGGFRATPINLAAGPAAVGYALRHSRARVIFVEPEFRPLLDQALAVTDADPHSGSHGDVPVFTLGPTGSPDWPAEICQGRAGDVRDLPELAPEDTALLMYTSGTTGRPKGVLHSHASLLEGGRITATAHGLTPADRAFCVLPLYHINGLCVTVMAPLFSGGGVIIARRFSAGKFWREVGHYEATWLSVVPTVISHLLHGKPENEPDAATLARLRFGRSASSPLPMESHRAFEERFGIPLIETMGLTETAAQILANPLPPGQRKPGSAGRAMLNEAMITDDDGRECPRGTVGELRVRGANLMQGYLDDPESTEAAFGAGGWFRTGDLGHMDGDGYVFITGRLKELIIKGGENIAPREIDEALLAHPDVVEAAAFPVPCPVYGQRVAAAVMLTGAAEMPDEATLLAFCADRVGAFKAPESLYFLESLPKGPSGKVQRLKLAEICGQAASAAPTQSS